MNNNLHTIIKMNFTDDLLLDSETSSFFRAQSAEPENKDKTGLFATSQGPNTTQKVFCVFAFIFKCVVQLLEHQFFVLRLKYFTSPLWFKVILKMSVTSLNLQRIHAKSLLDIYTVSLLCLCCMIKRKQEASFEASALSFSDATFIHAIHHCNFYTSGLLYTRAS